MMMTALAEQMLADEIIEVARSPDDLALLKKPGCGAVVWHRQAMDELIEWLDGVDADALPNARIIIDPAQASEAIRQAFDEAGTPDGAMRGRLIDDIARNIEHFAGLMQKPYMQVRLEVVRDDACRKFHMDRVTARFICTYRGTGTHYGIATDGKAPGRVFIVPTGSPILLRGTGWMGDLAAPVLHRSPPISASGQRRFLLVLDPKNSLNDACGCC